MARNIEPIMPRTVAINPPDMPGPIYACVGEIIINKMKMIKILIIF